MKSWRLASLAVAVLLLVVIGCSRTESKLVGKWQNENLPETLEFLDNKTGIFEERNRPPLPFKWSIQDNKVRLDVAIGGTAQPLMGELNNGLFVMRNGNLQATYRKMK